MNFTTMMAAASVNNGLTVSGGSGEPDGAGSPAGPVVGRHYTAADIPPGFLANASSIINDHGIRLISKYEGPPRLKARLCEGGRFELGKGITFHFDGRPVLEGETCDEEYAEALFVNALGVFANAVDELVTVPINANQRGALTILGYNIGIENLKSSTVLRETNAGRFDDAAAAFGMWVFATKNSYKQALRGLLRRQYATACYFLGYDDSEACADDAIALQRQKPATLPGRDTVIYKTPFKDVLRVAQRYPLPTLTVSNIPSVSIPLDTPAAPPQADAKAGTPEPGTQPKAPASPAQNSAAPAGPLVVADKGVVQSAPVAPPPAGTKPPSPNTVQPEHVPYRVDPTAGLKPMEETERFVGAALMLVGTFVRSGMANGMKVSGVGGVVVVGFLDLMKSPTNLAVTISIFAIGVTAIGWTIGVILDKTGLRKKKRGEQTATQAMY